MTTQRDRLAAVLDAVTDDVLAEMRYGDDYYAMVADALLARGVRVVDVETLFDAFAKAGVTLYEVGRWGELDSRTDAETILAALDAEP